jgi:hypothetical protein
MELQEFGQEYLKGKYMNYTSVTNPIWANEEHNVINCIVDFVDVGTVPFTANPLDTSNLSSKQIFDQCVTGDYGVIAEYVPPPPYVPTVEDNKNIAINLLSQTDWTTIPDVANPALSNPYLTNQAEFIAFRNQVRPIAINPMAGNIDFPTTPNPIWSV